MSLTGYSIEDPALPFPRSHLVGIPVRRSRARGFSIQTHASKPAATKADQRYSVRREVSSSSTVTAHIPGSCWLQLAAVCGDLPIVYPISPRAPRSDAWRCLQRDLQPAATRRFVAALFLRCATAACSSYGWR